MDVISLIIGFIIGVVLVGLAIEIGTKKTTHGASASKKAKTWSVSEISNPKVMAEYLSDIELPKNSKVIVNTYKNKEIFAGLDVREHKGIKGNFVVGDDRALILSGPVRKDEVAFWTVEKEIVEKLNQEFNAMWAEGEKIETEKTQYTKPFPGKVN